MIYFYYSYNLVMQIFFCQQLSILRSRAFFDDVCALAFALHPIKKAILKLESQSCTLADCFIGLAQLGAAINKLPENDYHVFVVNVSQYLISVTLNLLILYIY